MHLVERMTQSPPNCFVCGRGNTPDSDGVIGPFLDLERDVNWGDSTYLCPDCGVQIGGNFGMESPHGVQSLKAEIATLERRNHELRAEIDSWTQRHARKQKVA